MSGEALLALAARVEAATGADREIDAAIHAILGIRPPTSLSKPLVGEWVHTHRPDCYTASLDAALTLIAAPWRLSTVSDHGQGRWGACVTIPTKYDCGTMANGPALALTAAALRARALQSDPAIRDREGAVR